MVQSKNTDRAKELEREYLREWRRKNKDKMRQYGETYWLRKAEAEEKKREGSESDR